MDLGMASGTIWMFEIAVLRPVHTFTWKSTVTRIHEYFEETRIHEYFEERQMEYFWRENLFKIFQNGAGQAEHKSTESKRPSSQISMDLVFP